MRVPVPGGVLSVEERGSGLPVVFVHGGTGTAAVDWAPTVARLARRHRTVVMDMRGHGDSHSHDGAFGIVRFGLDALHVMSALGIPRAVLVGFSVGGNSLLTAVARDDRRALALVTIGAQTQGGTPEFAEQIRSGRWPSYLTEIEHAVGDGPDYWRTLRSKLSHDWVDNLAIRPERLAAIACPVLACVGSADPLVTVDESSRLAESIPGGELAVFEGAGHAVQLEQTDALVDRIESFLRRRLAPR